METRQESDGILVRQMRSDNSQERRMAWATWWEQDYTALERFVLKSTYRGLSAEDCKDIVSETFLRAFDGVSSGKYVHKNTPLIAYLTGISKNVISDFLRKQRQLRMVPLEVEDQDGETYPLQLVSDDETARCDERIDWQAHGKKLAQALAELPENKLLLLQLQYAGELKSGEIGQELGMSAEHVRRESHRIRQKLKRFLWPEITR